MAAKKRAATSSGPPKISSRVDLANDQVVALKFSLERAAWLVATHADELKELYEDPTVNYAELARHFFEDADQYLRVCEVAVGYALRAINTPEEQAELVRQHRKATFDHRRSEMGEEAFLAHMEVARAGRHKIYRPTGAALARWNGFVNWTDEERETVKRLMSDPEYCRSSEANSTKIAKYLNDNYHDGRPVRNRSAVSSQLQRFREEGQFGNAWSQDETAELRRLMVDPSYRWGSMLASKKVAARLNELFHGGREVRTSAAISRQTRLLSQG